MADKYPKIIVEKNPSQARLDELDFKSWPKWGCSPGKYHLKYEAEEICYIVKGRVKVYPKSSSSSSSSSSSPSPSLDAEVEWCVEFGAGDIVTLPKGLSCTWDVSLSVDKHYMFLHHSS
uniref:(S)-ureidoglycine aminohydrolase cupin domain-containing protein n=1 Tax=Noccaea caerulescens TaxID=107243 RepID=A0A1J3CPJ7_NOCCA